MHADPSITGPFPGPAAMTPVEFALPPPPLRPAAPRPRGQALPGLLLAAAVLLPLLLGAAFALSAWRGTHRGAEAELLRTAEAGAEYARRVLDGHRLGADRVNELLRGLTDAEIRAREPELHARLRELVAEMPQVRTAHVADRAGRLLLSASLHPVPADMGFADREWHVALSAPDAPPVLVGHVHRGRIEGNVFFVVARRRTGSGNPLPGPEAFDGVTSVTLWPGEVADGLRALLLDEATDRLGLLRADGEVIARTGAGEEGPFPPLPEGSRLRAALAAGEDRIALSGTGYAGEPVRHIALRRVEGYPLHVTASRPAEAVVARWWATVAWPLGLALASALALAALAWLLRRERRALQATHEALEARVTARTLELAGALEEIRQGEARLRLAMEAGGFGTWETEAATGRCHWDARLAEMLGLPAQPVEVEPAAMEGFIHPADRARAAAEFAAALREGLPFASEFRCIDAAGQERWLLSRGQPARDGDGGIRRMVGLVQDVTERRHADAARELLVRELAHRVKNALALVQAMSDQTLRACNEDPRHFTPAFRSRLQAMARAHDLLTARSWTAAPLAEVVGAALAPWLVLGPRRLALDAPQGRSARQAGPALSPQQAQALVLGLHELATNAAKSGALSTPEGRVVLGWSAVDREGWTELAWRESGGPPIPGPPPRRGFGMRLLERGLASGLGPGASVSLRFEAEGLCARLRFRPAGLPPIEVGGVPDSGAAAAAPCRRPEVATLAQVEDRSTSYQ